MASTEDLIQKALIASGTPVDDGPSWSSSMSDKQRRAMQQRIKNQRRELRRLNTACRGMDLLVRTYANKEAESRRNAYRHAAQMAENFRYWPFGKRIGAYPQVDLGHTCAFPENAMKPPTTGRRSPAST
jgi:hypothetical protein